jgi:hypothetical protein
MKNLGFGVKNANYTVMSGEIGHGGKKSRLHD